MARDRSLGGPGSAELPPVVLSVADFEALAEYSCTLPTGTTIGKRWKCRLPYRETPGVAPTWYLGEYYDIGDPTEVGVRWSLIVVDAPEAGRPYGAGDDEFPEVARGA